MAFTIELKDVSFAYEGCPHSIRGITLRLRGDEVTCVVAAVGEGKSTFLKLVAGLLEPTAGEIVIDGRIFWHLSDREQNTLRRTMGFDFQEGALIANMSIFQNLALPWRYHGLASEHHIARTVDDWLKCMRIFQYKDMLPAALSTGLRRRATYIRAMMSEGRYFFWDEPTEGTDDEHEQLIVDTLFKKKTEGVGSLVSTQHTRFLASVADRVIVLKDGSVSYDGPLKDGRIPVEFDVSGMLRG
jgi:phospholipid/cholesterol/gamma-HCH transport system ATP-binding protein